MPCYFPLEGYRSKTINASGKRSIVFDLKSGYIDMPVTLPCGQCIGCRLERSRQWAMRCVHETSLHADNCFITLTYRDEEIPSGGSLDKRHFQKFVKRLRRKYPEKSIRYFHCGEYGEVFRRPHYHAILFNIDFPDQQLWKCENENNLYTSATLSLLWPHGFSTVGAATFESAAYVARYVLKKINGDKADQHYENIIKETGEIYKIQPEYTTMSLNPAIGKDWFNKFETEVFPSDEVILRGKKMKPPKYYEKLFDLAPHNQLEKIKGLRVQQGKKHKADQTPRRLADRHTCKLAQIKTLQRKL